jgi:hypothetical protein
MNNPETKQAAELAANVKQLNEVCEMYSMGSFVYVQNSVLRLVLDALADRDSRLAAAEKELAELDASASNLAGVFDQLEREMRQRCDRGSSHEVYGYLDEMRALLHTDRHPKHPAIALFKSSAKRHAEEVSKLRSIVSEAEIGLAAAQRSAEDARADKAVIDFIQNGPWQEYRKDHPDADESLRSEVNAAMKRAMSAQAPASAMGGAV